MDKVVHIDSFNNNNNKKIWVCKSNTPPKKTQKQNINNKIQFWSEQLCICEQAIESLDFF